MLCGPRQRSGAAASAARPPFPAQQAGPALVATKIGIFSASASRAATGAQLSAASLAENSRDCRRWPDHLLCQPSRLPNNGTETISRTCTLVRTPDAGVARRTGSNAQAHLGPDKSASAIRHQVAGPRSGPQLLDCTSAAGASCVFWSSRCTLVGTVAYVRGGELAFGNYLAMLVHKSEPIIACRIAGKPHAA